MLYFLLFLSVSVFFFSKFYCYRHFYILPFCIFCTPVAFFFVFPQSACFSPCAHYAFNYFLKTRLPDSSKKAISFEFYDDFSRFCGARYMGMWNYTFSIKLLWKLFITMLNVNGQSIGRGHLNQAFILINWVIKLILCMAISFSLFHTKICSISGYGERKKKYTQTLDTELMAINFHVNYLKFTRIYF